MVNLWPGIPTQYLCDKHLNAAINEGLNLLIRYHMKNQHSVNGWVYNGCIEYNKIHSRIVDLIDESRARGKAWSYQFTQDDLMIYLRYQKVPYYRSNPKAIENNPNKLSERCIKCQEKIIDWRK